MAGRVGCHGLDKLVDLAVEDASVRGDDFLQLRARIGTIPVGDDRLILRAHELDHEVTAALLQPDLIGIDAITDVELAAHSSSGGGVDDPVLTTAQADPVGVDATIPGKRVVPLRAIENIVPGIAGERVVETGALEVL